MAAQSPKVLLNFINGAYTEPTVDNGSHPVTCPATGEVIAQVRLSSSADVDAAVAHASAAYPLWSSHTVKTRAQIMVKFNQLLIAHKDELAEIVMLEHGKSRGEALASIDKGNETVEWAFGLPSVYAGRIMDVSRGITCQDRRDSLGVVAAVVPFNFPIMVPMWTVPIALTCGNCVILKPSEKVPLTMYRVAALLKEAGVPDGVFQIVNGLAPVVEALCEHPDIKAVTFVGTSHVAKIITDKCHKNGKRVLALGGAKNHLIAAPDCALEMTSSDVVSSFTGCSGQRCMAASVLLTIGENQPLIDSIVTKSAALKPGQESGLIGPVIDAQSRDKIVGFIDEAEKGGAKILVDGRKWTNNADNLDIFSKGYWVGPTVILHTNKSDRALHEEIFGPVISILRVSSKEEAIEFENANPYGNAASIYTSSGAVADWFCKRFSVGMMGVNIGVPVPREPFTFGGVGISNFGSSDITGDGALEFFTQRKKITTKWGPPQDLSWLS